MLQCRLGVETFVAVQTAGCIQMGCTAGMGHDTHTHTSLMGTAAHYLLLDTGPHAAQQGSTPATVGRGKGSMDSAKATATLARCRADHATTAHSVQGTSAVSTHAPRVSSSCGPLGNVHTFWLSLCVRARQRRGASTLEYTATCVRG